MAVKELFFAEVDSFRGELRDDMETLAVGVGDFSVIGGPVKGSGTRSLHDNFVRPC